MRIGNATVMVGDARDEWPPMPASLYLYVDDADAATARAVAAGGTLIMPVADQPYRDRQSGVRDMCGNLWWISQRLEPGGYF